MNTVLCVSKQKANNLETGVVVKHTIKSTVTDSQFLIKKDISRDPYVIVNPIAKKKEGTSRSGSAN